MSLQNLEPGYRVLTLDLSKARTKVKFPMAGRLFYVLHTTGASTHVVIQFNREDADEITVYRNFKKRGPVNVFYLTNTVQAGHSISIIILSDPDQMDVEQLRLDLAGGVNLGSTCDSDQDLALDTTGKLLIASDGDRLAVTFYVEDQAILIGASLATAKFKIPAGGSFSANHTNGAIYGKAVTGTAKVYMFMEKE